MNRHSGLALILTLTGSACTIKHAGSDGDGGTGTVGGTVASTGSSESTIGSSSAGSLASSGSATDDDTASGATGGTTDGATDTTDTTGLGQPAECGAVTCQPGQICVRPGAECVAYEPGPDDPCIPGSLDFGCEKSESQPPFCAAHDCPGEPGDDQFLWCLIGEFCESSCFMTAGFADQFLECSPQWCHCSQW